MQKTWQSWFPPNSHTICRSSTFAQEPWDLEAARGTRGGGTRAGGPSPHLQWDPQRHPHSRDMPAACPVPVQTGTNPSRLLTNKFG